jgi:enoyl-CoA hydratase
MLLAGIEPEIEAGVAVLHLRRPPPGSGLKAWEDRHENLRDVFLALSGDTAVRAIVMFGEGRDDFWASPPDDVFSEIRGNRGAASEMMRRTTDALSAVACCPKPVVVGLSGAARNFGCQLTLASDFIIASSEALFQDSHVRAGVVAGDGGTVFWPLIFGVGIAKRHLLLGRPLTAEIAEQYGLIHELVADVDVQERSLACGAKLATLSPAAVSGTKLAIIQWIKLGILVSGDIAATLEAADFDPLTRPTAP